MQPLMAKLPALLLAAKSRGDSSTRSLQQSEFRASTRSSSRVPSRPSSSATSSSANGSKQQPKSRGKPGNQETHDEKASSRLQTQASSSDVLKKSIEPKPKKKSKPRSAPLSALEQVEKRKRMFAKWIKHSSSPAAPVTEASAADSDGNTTRLPPISTHYAQEIPLAAASVTLSAEPIRLPPINASISASEWDFFQPYVPSTSDPVANEDPSELSDVSLDEDAVNNLLNWTDTLAAPHELDAQFLDEDE